VYRYDPIGPTRGQLIQKKMIATENTTLAINK
jgi:hypothetical protein